MLLIAIMTAIIAIATIIICYLRFNYCSLKSKSYGAVTKLSRSQLKNLYHLNPRRWRYETIVEQGYGMIHTSYRVLLYNADAQWSRGTYLNTYREKDKIIRIQLSFITFLEFIYHAKRIIKKRAEIKGLEMVVNTAQKDIERLKQKANKEINQANQDMKDLQLRIQKEVELKLWQ